jgi:excisionase family DNA binding protein
MVSTPADFPPVLTAAQAADLLQIHVEYLRKLVREGKVPSHRFPGGRELRFLRDELLGWLGAQPGPAGEVHRSTADTATT